LSKGGSDNLDNKQALCQKCNNFKSDKLWSLQKERHLIF
jgi:5-methylcytosine-specific restriction endonuclease McrA